MRKLQWIVVCLVIGVWLLGWEEPVVTSNDTQPGATATSLLTPPQKTDPQETMVEAEKLATIGDLIQAALPGNKAEPEPAQSPDLYVTGDRVNQRAGPTIDARILGQLSKGARVRQLSSTGGWTEIVSAHGRGWMSSKYLKPNPLPAARTAPSAQPQRKVAAPTNREIEAARRAIIRQSLAAYPGSCPCPYNTDRAGRRCGGRSAWSKPGGYSPVCYESDVSQARLNSYLARQRGAAN